MCSIPYSKRVGDPLRKYHQAKRCKLLALDVNDTVAGGSGAVNQLVVESLLNASGDQVRDDIDAQPGDDKNDQQKRASDAGVDARIEQLTLLRLSLSRAGHGLLSLISTARR